MVHECLAWPRRVRMSGRSSPLNLLANTTLKRKKENIDKKWMCEDIPRLPPNPNQAFQHHEQGMGMYTYNHCVYLWLKDACSCCFHHFNGPFTNSMQERDIRCMLKFWLKSIVQYRYNVMYVVVVLTWFHGDLRGQGSVPPVDMTQCSPLPSPWRNQDLFYSCGR